jgi:hypothetical protein
MEEKYFINTLTCELFCITDDYELYDEFLASSWCYQEISKVEYDTYVNEIIAEQERDRRMDEGE